MSATNAKVSALLQTLESGEVATPADLLDHVAAALGKTILVVYCTASEWGSLTAACVTFEREALVFLRRDDSTLYQLNALLHEVGHLLLEHQGCGITPGAVPDGEWFHRSSEIIAATHGVDREGQVHELDAERFARRVAHTLIRPASTSGESIFG